MRKLGEPELQESLENTSFLHEFEDFHNAIRTNAQPYSTFEKGYRDLKVLLRAFETTLSPLP